jgi:hypothetical protein
MKHKFAISIGLLSLVFAAAPAKALPQYQNGPYAQTQNWRGALSSDDQQRFDESYAKWTDAQRNNDRDDISENARHMQDIMTRNNIPSNVPFDQIASNPVYPPNQAAYPNQPYPNQPYPAYGQARLSAEDQRKFDDDYAKWMNSQRKNDQDDIAKSADKMHEIMARNGIPTNVPFAAIVTNGYTAAGPVPYQPVYGSVPQRLSTKDQDDFNKDYRHWVDARRKRDIDDVDKNARKMQEIMARYNIPANVPFDQIATYH